MPALYLITVTCALKEGQRKPRNHRFVVAAEDAAAARHLFLNSSAGQFWVYPGDTVRAEPHPDTVAALFTGTTW